MNNKISKQSVIFIIMEILIFIMFTGTLFTEVIFPPSLEQRLGKFYSYSKWSSRLIDNIVTIYCMTANFIVFILSIIGVFQYKKMAKNKQITKKNKIMFFITGFNLFVSAFFSVLTLASFNSGLYYWS